MVCVFLADGVAEMEVVTITEVLRRAGIDTRLAGVTGTTVTGARGVKLLADMPISELSETSYEMLVLPGGLRGVDNLHGCERVCELLRDAFASGKPVGAICAAPKMLAGLGLISGRTVTCYPSVADEVREGGAYVLDRSWVREGSLITGRGPASSIAFTAALISLLRGDEKADEVAEQLLVSWRNPH